MLSNFHWGGNKRFRTQVFLEYRFTSCPSYLELLLRNGLELSHFGGHFWAITSPDQLALASNTHK